MTTVLVTGAGGPAGWNFVEALRLLAHPPRIVGVDSDARHLALSQADVRYLVPPASSPHYLQALGRLVGRERVDLVHPQPDAEVAALAGSALPTFLPPAGVVARCADKIACHRVLDAAGVPVPEAYAVTSPERLDWALDQLLRRYPRAWLRAACGAGSRASLPVTDPGVARAWVAYWTPRGVGYGDFQLSEFLPGREVAWQGVWRDGELVAHGARERVEYVFGNLTPHGQSSSPAVARTIRDLEADSAAERAVRAVVPRPHGVFGVDMKAAVDGRLQVTEINAGRFYTTSLFLASAGCNLPALYVALATGQPVPECPEPPSDLWWVRQIDMGHRLCRASDFEHADARQTEDGRAGP